MQIRPCRIMCVMVDGAVDGTKEELLRSAKPTGSGMSKPTTFCCVINLDHTISLTGQCGDIEALYLSNAEWFDHDVILAV